MSLAGVLFLQGAMGREDAVRVGMGCTLFARRLLALLSALGTLAAPGRSRRRHGGAPSR